MYGTVQDAVVMKDPVSRRSRGFGFITFTDIHAVDNALADEPHTIDERKVRNREEGRFHQSFSALLFLETGTSSSSLRLNKEYNYFHISG